jgi:Fis family transcriptional regulator
MSKKQIEDCIKQSVDAYFRDLRGTEPHDMYDMVLRAVEKPLLETVMDYTAGNQSLAADWLGINRNTLRKKLLDYKLIR